MNAQRVLDEIGSDVREALEKSGAVPMHSTQPVIVCLLPFRLFTANFLHSLHASSTLPPYELIGL